MLKEMIELFIKVKDGLFSVWVEEDDPTLYYYPGLESHMNMDLLWSQIRRKKVLGLFIILNFLNILYLALPE